MLHMTGIKYMEKTVNGATTRENIVIPVTSYTNVDAYLAVYAHELEYAIAYKKMPIEGGTETCIGLGMKVFDDDLNDVFKEVWFRQAEPEEEQPQEQEQPQGE